MHQVGALSFSVELAEMAKLAKDLADAQRMTAGAATGMATQLEAVKNVINDMAAAEKARASAFDRSMQESKRLIEVFKRGVTETSDALGNLKIDPDAMKVPQDAIRSLQLWRDKAVYAIGSGVAEGWEKAKSAWEEFKSWTERQVVIWGVALAVGVSAAVVGAAYAAFKGISFAVGLLTGESYKSKNIDALIAQTNQAKELGDQLHITAQQASALRDALNRLGVPKADFTSVWTSAAGAVRTNTEELERLGIAYKDSNGKLLETRTFLENVRTSLEKYTEGWDRTQAETAIGVGSLEKVTEVLKVTDDQISQSRDRLNDFNLGIGPETQEAVANYQRSMREFNNESDLTSEGFKRAIADTIMPMLADLADFFKEGFPTAVNAFRYTIAEIMSLFYGLKTVVFLVAESIVGSISSIGSVLGGLASASAKVMAGDFGGAKEALFQGWNDAKTRLGQIGDNIVEQAKRNGAAMRLAFGFDNRGAPGTRQPTTGSPWVPPPPPKDGGGVDEGTRAYDALIKRVKERLALQEEEITRGRDLTEEEKFANKVRADAAELLAKFPGLHQAELDKLRAKLAVQTQSLVAQRLELELAKQIAQTRQSQRNTDYEQSAQGLRDIATAYAQSLKAAKDAAQSQVDDNEAAQLAIKLNVGLSEAVQMVTIARLEEKKSLLTDESDGAQSIQKEIEARKELLKLLGDRRVFDQQVDLWKNIDQTAQDVFRSMFENGQDAFKRLGQSLKRELIDLLFQLVARPIMIQIGASLGIPGANMAAQALGGGGGGMGGIGSLLGNAGSLASLGSIGTAFTAGSTSVGVMAGSIAGGGGLLGGAASALGAMGPVGWIGLAALAAYSIFGKKGGGPKTESGFGPGVPSRGDPSSSMQIAKAIQQQYEALVGSSAGQLDLGVFSATDPKGTAKTQLALNAVLNGSSVYSREARTGGVENVGRSDAELQAAVTEDSARALLAAVKATDGLSDSMRRILSTTDAYSSSLDEINKALTRVQKASTEQRALEEQIFQLTHTSDDILARDRKREIDALDDTTKALGERVHALQDEKQAADTLQQALGRAKDSSKAFADFMAGVNNNVRGYIDRLNGTPAGLLPPEQQLANARLQFDQQIGLARAGNREALQGVTGYADQLIQAQTGVSASGVATANTIAMVKAALASLPGFESQEDVLARTIRETSQDQVDATKSAADKIWEGLWGSAGLLSQKFDDFDVNLSGGLDFSEIKDALGPLATDATIKALIARADTNSDGQISKEEAIRAAIRENTVVTVAVAPAKGTVASVHPELFPADAQIVPGSLQDILRQRLGSTFGLGSADTGFMGEPVASGGVFTNSVISGTTPFLSAHGKLFHMGEAGPEGVLPLVDIGGNLGVRYVGGDNSEVAKLLQRVIDLLENNVVVTAAGARGTIEVLQDVRENTSASVRRARLAETRAPVGAK